jgi:hypothetical protein
MSTTLGLDPNLTAPISICLPGGNGQILSSLGSVSDTINNNLGSISTSMNTTSTYGSYDTTNLTAALANITNAITDFKEAKRNDITYVSSTLNTFKAMADRTHWSGCTDAAFDADSLVPNTDAASVADIPCSVATVQAACTSFQAACAAGCLNLYSIFNGYIALGGTTATQATALEADLATRYAGLTPACLTSVQTDISNMFKNWHTPRVDATAGITSVQTRYTSGVQTDINNIITTLGTLTPKMTSTFTSLNTTMNPLVDPTYGLIAGINCLLIGEDIILMKNTVCVSLFNSLYFLFVTIGTSSFALLFSMCCIVCSGVRHYKQSQKKSGQALAGDSQTFIGKH